MGILYDFSRLLRRYSVDFALETKGAGSWVDGVYQPGAAALQTLRGAVVPLPEELVLRAEGKLSKADRQLILPAPLKGELAGLHVLYGGARYSVEQATDHSDYADVAVYLLRWVSAFDSRETD